MKFVSLIFALGILLATAQSSTEQPIPVSLIQLIANPEKYDGKLVFGIGFLNLSREGDILYVSREDFDNVILENGIWIDRTEEIGRNREKLNLKYVKFVGTFHAGHRGHAYYHSGGMSDIKSCIAWSDPGHPLRQKMDEMRYIPPGDAAHR